MKLSNGVEMYEIEVTKMDQNYSFFLTVRRMICGIKVVFSLFHLRYLLTMCIHLFSGGKLLFTGSCMVSIPTQENDL